MVAQIDVFDKNLWSATRYSDVLNLDHRLVRQALQAVPSQQIGKREFWHIRDGMPAIFKRVFGIADGASESYKAPRDRLDHYRAERERIKLELEQRMVIPLAEAESAMGAVFKALALQLETLPAALERDYGLPADQVERLYQAMDAAREVLHTAAIGALE